MATKFCTVASNICGPSVWLLSVTLLAPRILRRLLDFWKIVHPCLIYYISSASPPTDPGSRAEFSSVFNTRQAFVVLQTITFSALSYFAEVTAALPQLTKVVDW